ncbi:hypothetical protein AR457_00805 [Streptomyces agglomeratus]|nr:hypothetical protein [Streptomyces agglomeratus]OEJ42864.1 hypothetical protein AR457_00805 [Streptomyces agglomeratus]
MKVTVGSSGLTACFQPGFVPGEQSEVREVHGQAGKDGEAVCREEALLDVLVAQGKGPVTGVAEVGLDAGQDAGCDPLAAVVGVNGDGVDVTDPAGEGVP